MAAAAKKKKKKPKQKKIVSNHELTEAQDAEPEEAEATPTPLLQPKETAALYNEAADDEEVGDESNWQGGDPQAEEKVVTEHL